MTNSVRTAHGIETYIKAANKRNFEEAFSPIVGGDKIKSQMFEETKIGSKPNEYTPIVGELVKKRAKNSEFSGLEK